MRATFKQGLILFFKGWIKNDACREGAKLRPWWSAVIIGILSVFLGITPTMVYYGTYEGTAQIHSIQSVGLERVYTNFQMDLLEYGPTNDPINLIINPINETQTLTNDDKSWVNALGTYTGVEGSPAKPWVLERDPETVGETGSNSIIEYEVYYGYEIQLSTETDVVGKIISDYLLKGLDATGNKRPDDYYGKNSEGEQNEPHIRNSFTYYSKTFFVTYIINRNSQVQAKYSGEYDQLTNGYNFNELGKVTINEQPYTSKSFTDGVADATLFSEYQRGVFNNYESFYRLGYYNTKWTNFWIGSSITLASFVGLILLLGFVIWLSTRGTKKRPNPLRTLTIIDCFKMICWLSFSPGALSMLAFVIPGFMQFAQVFFVGFLTLRAMYFNFRTLNLSVDGVQPGQPTNKPLPRGRG